MHAQTSQHQMQAQTSTNHPKIRTGRGKKTATIVTHKPTQPLWKNQIWNCNPQSQKSIWDHNPQYEKTMPKTALYRQSALRKCVDCWSAPPLLPQHQRLHRDIYARDISADSPYHCLSVGVPRDSAKEKRREEGVCMRKREESGVGGLCVREM